MVEGRGEKERGKGREREERGEEMKGGKRGKKTRKISDEGHEKTLERQFLKCDFSVFFETETRVEKDSWEG